MSPRFPIIAALCLSCMPALSPAQVYKWVDDNGVVNYSSSPPGTKGGAKKAEVIEDRVSVIGSDPVVLKALEDAKQKPKPAPAATPALADKVERLERELQNERRAREAAQAASSADAQARRAAVERCIAERGIDCDALPPGYTVIRPVATVPPRPPVPAPAPAADPQTVRRTNPPTLIRSGPEQR